MENRRHFLKKIATISLSVSLKPAFARSLPDGQGKIVTVTGAIAPRQMGVALIHEHLMSTFGQEKNASPVYDQEKLFAQVLPYLKHIKSLGCQTIAECTAAYFGRDPQILQQLSRQSGLYLLTNTGYYGAADDRYVPDQAFKEDAEAVASLWIQEWEQGIGETGIRPGFIKTAIDKGALSAIDAKLVRAAALTHKETGLTIACHTGNNPEGAMQTLEILREEGVEPAAWLWTHANQADSLDALLPAAQKGGWLSLDGVRIASPPGQQEEVLEKHVGYIKTLKEKGYLNQVLVSHDGNAFPGSQGGTIRPFEAVFTHLAPRLRQEGFTQKEIDQLLIRNPQEAFIVRKRLG